MTDYPSLTDSADRLWQLEMKRRYDKSNADAHYFELAVRQMIREEVRTVLKEAGLLKEETNSEVGK